ncbi:protein NYNRIN-like [Camellia sinensis]|uniref:protein NYNRIN-like n=1 Tax=Camellia sinensis TaxID=4442 RepID=UPI0010369781|nr:protein NYNRIN-like [Camellia sinensis]
MDEDAKNFVRKCQSSQKFGNLIHAPAVELHNIKTPYPFYTWAFDLMGLIAHQSKGHRWILASTEVSTKWVEAILMRKVDGAGVANFIKENIICRFGIPKVQTIPLKATQVGLNTFHELAGGYYNLLGSNFTNEAGK